MMTLNNINEKLYKVSELEAFSPSNYEFSTEEMEWMYSTWYSMASHFLSFGLYPISKRWLNDFIHCNNESDMIHMFNGYYHLVRSKCTRFYVGNLNQPWLGFLVASWPMCQCEIDSVNCKHAATGADEYDVMMYDQTGNESVYGGGSTLAGTEKATTDRDDYDEQKSEKESYMEEEKKDTLHTSVFSNAAFPRTNGAVIITNNNGRRRVVPRRTFANKSAVMISMGSSMDTLDSKSTWMNDDDNKTVLDVDDMLNRDTDDERKRDLLEQDTELDEDVLNQDQVFDVEIMEDPYHGNAEVDCDQIPQDMSKDD